MIKPTATLNFNVIEHVMTESKIADLIIARDKQPQTLGMEIRCRIIPEKSNPVSLFYILEFIYKAPENMSHHDDIAVLVEVTEGPSIQILEFKIN
ncbi:hypothetical protein [Flavobacterium phycosphaerae]|uniref:hypothetical protein n=1 Tax=Flavobacterium phycosphaerae TaxID=2697515 RepID=UPI00138A44CA|nr:hypothetical protein [Flavobacterium phycosphaerae]